MEDCVSVHVGTTEGPSVPPTNRVNRVINTISLMVFFQKKKKEMKIEHVKIWSCCFKLFHRVSQ